MNIIEIKNATVYNGQTKALDNLSLTIPLGEHHAILGPNGAGKTTLLKLISRERRAVVRDETVVKVFDEERILIWELRKQIGLVSQDLQQDYESLATGFEVVLSAFFGSVGIHMHHEVTEEMRNAAREMMASLEIGYLADRAYLQLSSGQQRRLLLARALIHQPRAIILDEPTNSLDLASKFWLIKQLRKLAQQGVSIILVTHDPQEIFPEIQKTSLLKDGEVFASGSTQAMLTSDKLSALYDTSLRVIEHDGFFQVLPTG